MNRCTVLFAVLACSFVTACASVPAQTASTSPDEQIQVTGSRLPTKDRATSSSVKTIDNQSDVGTMLQRANPNNMPPMGGGR